MVWATQSLYGTSMSLAQADVQQEEETHLWWLNVKTHSIGILQSPLLGMVCLYLWSC